MNVVCYDDVFSVALNVVNEDKDLQGTILRTVFL